MNMRGSLPTELLLKLMHATPEQMAEIERVLMLSQGVNPLHTKNGMGEIHAMFCELRREIAAVRKDYHELRRAKAELERMRADGLFQFTNKIDPESFRLICAVLVHGDVAKAGRALNENDSTLRTRMAEWKRRGPAYQVLIELVRWRKSIGRRQPGQLSEEILGGKAANTDFAGLLSDVLDELLSVNEGNWETKCDELAALLRPHAAR
jgi:hypothetical protein